MSRVEIAQQTLAIVERGSYQLPSGEVVELRDAIDGAVRGTRLYGPEELRSLVETPRASRGELRIEVTDETTATAARRLLEREQIADVAALNFASARSPGGGFLGGAKAQEEDLARCSASTPA